MTTELTFYLSDEADYPSMDTSVNEIGSEQRNYLHSALGDRILFPSWTIKSSSETVGVCAMLFMLSFLERGLSFLVHYWLHREEETRKSRCLPPRSSPLPLPSPSASASSLPWLCSSLSSSSSYVTAVTSLRHLLCTFTYGLQLLILCLLLLAVTSFNTWVLTSIICGSVFGTLLLPRSLYVSSPEKSVC